MCLKTAEILLAESCHEQVSFESVFKQRKGRRISEIGWQRVPDGRCKKAEGTPLNVFVLRFGTLRSFSHDERRFRVGSYAHRVCKARAVSSQCHRNAMSANS